MRRLLVVSCLLGFFSHAGAAEFDTPTLRGTTPFIPAKPVYTRWAGFYAGGQLGHVSSNMDFRDSFDSLNIFDSSQLFTQPLGRVSTWGVFGQNDQRGTSYGGFVGYNTQWDEVIVGVEANYSRASVSGSSSDTRCFSNSNPQCFSAIGLGDGNQYNANIVATATASITDYGTLRARAGWAYRNVLPYVIGGIAVARVDVRRTATVDATPTGAGSAFVHTESDVLTRFTWGYSVGGGVDFLVMPNVFVRGEYEFIWLNPVGDINLNISTARVGAGVKF